MSGAMAEVKGRVKLCPDKQESVSEESMVEQSLHWPISPMDHSKLHSKGIDHEHYPTGVMLDVRFFPSVAYGVLPLSLDHKYIFDIEIEYPLFDESGDIEIENLVYTAGKKLDESTYEREFRPARLKTGKVNIKDLIIRKARKVLECDICINEVLDDARQCMNRWDEARGELKAYNESARREFLRKERETALLFEKRQKEEAIREEQQQKSHNEWIRKCGSLRLNKCLEEGYDYRELYYVERGMELFGKDFRLDYDNSVLVETCKCPSLMALETIEVLRKKGFSGRSIWLPKGLKAADNNYDSVSCEAVLVFFEDRAYYRTFGD